MARNYGEHEAELRIRFAIFEDEKELDLSDIRLTEIPESLKVLKNLISLDISNNKLTQLPAWLPNRFPQLRILRLYGNELKELPDSFADFSNLRELYLGDSVSGGNRFTAFPNCIRYLLKLEKIRTGNNIWSFIPDWIGDLKNLRELNFSSGKLTDIPSSIAQLQNLDKLNLDNNPLNPELAQAYKQGFQAIKTYLRARTTSQIALNEAKLIIVGEGEVGKTCLMDALLSLPWSEHNTTHGIEIKPIKVLNPDTQTEITLNAWDFGGQRVYRPTHQLFFSAPAVYLVVWKPREGHQQGLVREWIQLIKHREPEAKILVVATHGGPEERQPDIDRQELWDHFGKNTVIDFLHVENKPDINGNRTGIDELRRAIARVASTLPEIGRSVPKNWQRVRKVLVETKSPYLSLDDVLELCHTHQMDDGEARLFITIEHQLGHLIHYQHDPALRDIVILKPDWLATAISFVLDDKIIRKAHGLARFSRLSEIWNDANRKTEFSYPAGLHPLFIRLMERFDLSYKVVLPNEASDAVGFWQNFKAILDEVNKENDVLDHLHYTSLIAQLVPDTTPEIELEDVWTHKVAQGDYQQVQICRIVDEKGQSASAEGLFYQLIVRLHKYSLGREDYSRSVHWQHGLVLDDEYNGRALLRHIGNDVHITVRAPYPERFLAMLTEEVRYLVESFWEGLRCDVTVPCLNPNPCLGLFEVRKLIENKRRQHSDQPCPVCNEWQSIDQLLSNAPSVQPETALLISTEFAEVKAELAKARRQITYLGETTMKRFDRLDDRTRRTLSRVDKAYSDLLQILTDEAKEGPRLFSLVPVNRKGFNPREWIQAKFYLTLWCEHSRQPLTSPNLNGLNSKKGVYEIELDREWFKRVAPYLKFMMGTLSLVLPVATSGIKLSLDETAYKIIEEQLDFGKSVIEAVIGESKMINKAISPSDKTNLEQSESILAHGEILRELHALIKAKDPGFGGLVRVMNKRQEFIWVHPKFEKEY